jgi:hypothetical protein
MIIDYFDAKSYGGIQEGIKDRGIDSRNVINIESKKKYFRVWFRREDLYLTYTLNGFGDKTYSQC